MFKKWMVWENVFLNSCVYIMNCPFISLTLLGYGIECKIQVRWILISCKWWVLGSYSLCIQCTGSRAWPMGYIPDKQVYLTTSLLTWLGSAPHVFTSEPSEGIAHCCWLLHLVLMLLSMPSWVQDPRVDNTPCFPSSKSPVNVWKGV